MKKKFNIIIFLVSVVLICVGTKKVYSQEEGQSASKMLQFPEKIFRAIDKKTASLEQKLVKQTQRYLSKMERQEKKLKNKLSRKDSILVKQLFDGVDIRYNKLKHFSGFVSKCQTFYSSHLDSLSTSLSFLKALNLRNPLSKSLLQNAFDHYNSLQGKFDQVEQVRNFINERQRILKKQFERLGMTKAYMKFRKEVYYYKAQVQEYQNLFTDPSKVESKLVTLVQRIPQFKEFFAKNSMLASLFPSSQRISSVNAGFVIGLQTRAQVVSFIQNQIGSGIQNANALIQRNVQNAQGQMDELRNKLDGLSSASDLEMPDFKPKTEKTKSFFQRIEYGTNLQTQHSSYYFPITTDVGMSVAYKLNDKNIIGFGASYKLGWGKDIRHIGISSQGAGFRSFADINIRKSVFVSGGFEYNYQKPFNAMRQISFFNDWHRSGLIGATKIISMKTKIFKKTKVQLLWDFLSYQQRPQTQALKFRIGYSF